MQSRTIDSFSIRSSRLDRLIEWTLIALLALMPLALGAVEAWSELAVTCIAGFAGLCLALKLVLHRRAGFVASWSYLPIMLLVSFVALQLLPLPTPMVAKASPGTVALKTRLLSDLPDAHRVLSAMTLSFYPPATRAALRMMLAAFVVLIVVANVFRSAAQIKRLLGAIVIIGVMCAGLAIAQDMTGADAIFWIVKLGGRKATGGPFVNYNNFSQFMNLSIGAAIALLLVTLDEMRLGRRSIRTIYNRLSRAELRAVKLLGGAVLIASLSIFMSGSRGGMVSLALALIATIALAALRRDRTPRAWALVAMGVVVLGGVIYCSFEAVASRLTTLADLRAASGARWQTNQDVIAMLPKFPLIGIGLANHQPVYPMFSRQTDAAVSTEVENEYVQLAEEAGAIGVTLLLALAGVVIAQLRFILHHGDKPIHAAGFGIAFALIAVAIHSVSDFGQRIPANACLTATMCGLLVSLGRSIRREAVAQAPKLSILPRYAALLCGFAVFAWAAVGAFRAAKAEAASDAAYTLAGKLENVDWNGSDDEFAALITTASAAVDAEPDNAECRYWLNIYRWRSISRDVDPATGDLRMSAEELEFARHIVDDLHVARALCPTLGDAYCLAGQIELFVLDMPQGADHIRTGFELAPNDRTTTFIAGRLDACDDKWQTAGAKFHRSLAVGSTREAVVEEYLRRDRADLALELVRDDRIALDHLNWALTTSGKHADIAERARARQLELIRLSAASANATSSDLAQMAGLLCDDRDYAAAAAYYRRALAGDYANVGWRLGLAQALAQSGEVAQAMREARVCLRLRPEFADAQKLIGELSVRPGKGAPEAN